MEIRRSYAQSIVKLVAATLLVTFSLPHRSVSAQTEIIPASSVTPPAPVPFGEGPVLVGERMPASEAIDRVGESRIAKANAGLSVDELSELAADSDLWVDARGRLLYVDTALHTGIEDSHDEHAHESGHSDEGDFEAVAPLDDTFELQSRPGSNRTIYLDFNGAVVTNTAWNEGGPDVITAPAFDRDGDGANFSEYERLFIQEVWAHVAEDYAPFDVNVTTKDMGSDVYIRSSLWDFNFGSHVVITNEIVGDVCGGFSCAGVAYLDVFDWTLNELSQPAWSFAFDYGPIYAALTISHEVGHNLGLSHDGKSSSAYYGGQGSWGPIMGGGATRPIYQWSNGDYSSPTNTEDDLGVMTGNGISFISDDYTDDAGNAGLINLSTPIEGVISTRSDVDVFKMEISAGTLSLRASPAIHSPNLDIQLDVYDASNTTVLAQSNPASSFSNTQSSRTTLTSTGMGSYIDYESPSSQTVYVHVSGVGEGNPATTGYSDYGSLGRYTLSASNPDLEIIVHGPGTISGTGISCSTNCTYQHTPGTNIVLTATPTGDATIAYWTGACENVDFGVNQTTTCTVPMDQAREVGAVFRYNRSVTVTKSGSGTVADDTYGWSINCGVTCSYTDWRPYVTLVATPSLGYQFGGWSGGCTHEELRCTLLMTESKNVLATFATENTLSVDVVGNGNVVSNPVGIDCDGPTNGSACTHVFDATTSVTLTATAISGHVFTGWSGACSGTSTCTISMNNARSVTATFESGGTLSVNVEGAGTVTSEPEGISCNGPTEGTPCTAGFLASETVTLTATPDNMSTFDGWSGDCSGTDTCTVTMTQSRSVTATFIPSYLLDVDLTGTSSGTVSADIGYINCSGDPYSTCAEYFPEGTVVTLTAVDNPGFFEGWSGACSGSSRTCAITIDASNNVTAEFEQGESVYATASGGAVSISEGWITCNSGWCTGYKPTGSSPYLTAIPDRGYTFVGWSSTCTGLGTCSVGSSGSVPGATFKAPSPIDAGLNFSCRAQGNGAKCWGDNSSGQIGNNSLATAMKSVSVNNLSGVAAVVTGGQHACGLLNSGAVKCWGKNTNGQLGNNSLTNAKTPVSVSGISSAQSLSAGDSHTCALMENGTVRCWGRGQGGRLGNAQTSDQKTSIQVTGIGGGSAKAVAVSAGDEHTCALLTTGAIRCWGSNTSGQLGNNSTTASNIPVAVQGVSGAIGVSAGGQHTCALLATGAIKCWGRNTNGQLGNNTVTNSKTAVSVSGVSGASMVSAGSAHTCAVIPGAFFGPASVKCWGSGANGRLGRGSTSGSRVPVASTSTTNAAYVMAGGSHTCAAFGSGQYTFKCWGAGTSGQIGNNKLIDILTAVAVT